MIATLQCVVVDCPDPVALAGFYQRILGGTAEERDPEWVTLRAPDGTRLAFQRAPDHRPPRWPDPERPQQLHLDFDLATRADVERVWPDVESWGAEFLHDSGGTDKGFVVFADPSGHPFCLCYGQASTAP